MIFRQKVNYQKIDGKKGRECSERWDFIKNKISNESGLSIDIGSAEGYFSKKLVESGNRVVSIEGSEHVIKRQETYCKSEIEQGKIVLINTKLTHKNIDFFTESKNYDNCLLLSVLHWFDNPDFVLNKLCGVSKNIFVELPELDDKKAWNQAYINRIKSDFGSLDNYLEKVSGKKIIDFTKVDAHTSAFRKVYHLG